MIGNRNSVTKRLIEGLGKIKSKHSVIPDALVMNLDVIVLLGRECGLRINLMTVGKRRFIKADFGVTQRAMPTFMGLKLVGNDYLDVDTVLVTQKIGIPGDVTDEVVGRIDLKPEPSKPEPSKPEPSKPKYDDSYVKLAEK